MGQHFLVLAFVSALLTGCNDDAPSAESQFETAAIEFGEIRDIVPALARIRSAAAVEVGAEVSGRIVELPVTFNQKVKRGDLLARIDPMPFEASLRNAQAMLATATAGANEANARYQLAKSALERGARLVEADTLNRSSLEELKYNAMAAKAAFERAAAGVKSAEAKVQDAEIALRRTQVLSPIDGFILDRRIEIGQVINSSQTTPVLFLVSANMTDLVLEASVAERDIGRVSEGMKARFSVEAYPGVPFDGIVEEIRRSPNQRGRFVSYPVIIKAEDPFGYLFPGMTASVELINKESQRVLRAPIRSVYFRPQDYVPEADAEKIKEFLPNFDELGPAEKLGAMHGYEIGNYIGKGERLVFFLQDGKPVKRGVKVGIESSEYIEISSPEVSEGDFIIVRQKSK